MQAPLNTKGTTVTLDLFVDQSSVEIFTENGSMSMTNLVFPKSIYNRHWCHLRGQVPSAEKHLELMTPAKKNVHC